MLRCSPLRYRFTSGCLLACLCSGQAWADSWTGRDKAAHFFGSVALAGLVTTAGDDPQLGFWTTVAVGAAKVWADGRRPGGDASLRDLVVDVAGAYADAEAGRWLMYRRGETTAVLHVWRY